MRVSIVNLSLAPRDATGQSMLDQVSFFQQRGEDVRVYVQLPPRDVPEDVVALTRVVSLADLIARRDTHFACSDLYVYHYSGRHALMESIKGIDRGMVLFYYHNVTPPELWGSDFGREILRRNVEGVGSLVHYADLIVADSLFNADQLVREHDCERGRIRVLPLAVPIDQFTPGSPDVNIIQQHNLEGRRVVLYVGRMAGNKRIDLLVEALPLVQQKVPDATLLLVGDNHSNQAFVQVVAHARSRAVELGVADDVIFTGIVDDLPAYYRLANVYVTASLHEGFGVPPIEAMASGIPVVASRATAHPWVIGEAGLLVEPDDAADLADKIVRVLTDDDLRGELVQRGLSRAHEFSLEHYQDGWSKIVAEATARLSDQPYPRPRSLPAQPVALGSGSREENSVTTLHDVLLRGSLEQLDVTADVMMRGYTVRSGLPVIGPLIAWIRRTLTSHLREPYVDPTFERQVTFNRQVVQLVRHVIGQVATYVENSESASRDSIQRQEKLESRLSRIENWLGLMSAQVSSLEADHLTPENAAQLAKLHRQVETLHRELTEGEE